MVKPVVHKVDTQLYKLIRGLYYCSQVMWRGSLLTKFFFFFTFFFVTVLKSRKGWLFRDDNVRYSGREAAVA